MTDFPITVRRAFGNDIHLLTWQQTAALTATNGKWQWVIPFPARIVDVICNSETVGSGGVSDIIDVHLNGTTIYTTQANRPTLLVGDTGMFTEAGEPEVVVLRTGDILSVDVDQIATTGSALFSITIILVRR